MDVYFIWVFILCLYITWWAVPGTAIIFSGNTLFAIGTVLICFTAFYTSKRNCNMIQGKYMFQIMKLSNKWIHIMDISNVLCRYSYIYKLPRIRSIKYFWVIQNPFGFHGLCINVAFDVDFFPNLVSRTITCIVDTVKVPKNRSI